MQIFESILKCDDKRNVKSKLYQKHTACGYSYKRVSSLAKYAKDIVLYRAEDSHDDVAERFVNNLLKEATEIMKIMQNIIPMNLTDKQENEFAKADKCHLCGKAFNNGA